jgi:poly(A) polymerase
VRDLLLGREPKDFDIGTDAAPQAVRELFRNCRLIGRRFRLAHVHFGPEVIEVATFRGLQDMDDDNGGEAIQTEKGRIVADNVYGTIEEDAIRRDFTVNALYYDIDDFRVLDYVDGVADLEKGLIRVVGDPDQRYREDPVRMLRAVRFAVKLGFRIHPDSEGPLSRLGGLLADIPPARLFDEVLKLLLSGYGLQSFEALRHYGLFASLFPLTERSLATEENGFPHTLLIKALENSDRRIAEGKPVTPAFIYAALLWDPMREAMSHYLAEEMPDLLAMHEAADEVLASQIKHTALPRRFSIPMREIWVLQERLKNTSGKRPMRLREHPRFRAAYDFMLLRNEAGEDLQALCDWWTRFQETDPSVQPAAGQQIRSGAPRRRRRRRRTTPETTS